MKIIYIASSRLPSGKANGLAVMKMSEAFARMGSEVEMIVPKSSNAGNTDLYKYYGVENIFPIKRLFCIDVPQLGAFGFRVFLSTFTLTAFCYCIFRKVDYYYSRDDFSLWFISFFKKNVVWESHTAKTNWHVRGLVLRAKRLVVLTEGLKKHYVSLGVSPKNIIVEPSGVDLELFDRIGDSKEELRQNLNLSLDKKIISYVGRFRTIGQSKGVEELPEAVRKIVDKHRVLLLLVGAGKRDLDRVPEEYEQIVSSVPSTEVPLYMKASDVLVMNYPNTEHYANFMSPLKLFEYMASNVPIVTSDLPAIREVLDENTAFFFEPGSVEGLADALDQILENYPEAQRRANLAFEKVQNYSWIRRAGRVIEFVSS